MKILIATFPRDGDVRFGLAKWMASESAKAKSLGFSGIDVEAFEGTHLAMQRNWACEYAIKKGYTGICMVDSDQVPAEGSLEAAVTVVADHPFSVATCPTVSSKGRVLIWDFLHKGLVQRNYGRCRNYKGVEKVGRGTGGFVFASPQLFRKLPTPWFCDEFDSQAMISRTKGQDIYFYDKCRENDVSIYCLWDYWMEHIKPMPLLEGMKNSV